MKKGEKSYNDDPLNAYVFHHQEGLYDVFDITPPEIGSYIFQIFGSHKVYRLVTVQVGDLYLGKISTFDFCMNL